MKALLYRILRLVAYPLIRVLNEIEVRLVFDIETLTERLITIERSISRLEANLLPQPETTEGSVGSSASLPRVEELDQESAELINLSNDPEGFSARAGLWFNPPVFVVHQEGRVLPAHVNERIVEVPFAMGVAARLPQNSLVVDVGSSESTFSLSLASLGLRVYSVDPRGYPLTHPLLQSLQTPIQDWEGPPEPAGAIFCISTIEHLGLGAYEQENLQENSLDSKSMDLFRSWLADRGELVLTVPYGLWSVTDLQRTYDSEHLDQLLEGWQVIEKRIAVQTDPLVWTTVSNIESPSDGMRAVAMVRATPHP